MVQDATESELRLEKKLTLQYRVEGYSDSAISCRRHEYYQPRAKRKWNVTCPTTSVHVAITCCGEQIVTCCGVENSTCSGVEGYLRHRWCQMRRNQC